MDELKIKNINNKFLNIKKKLAYLNGLTHDDQLKNYAETYQIQNLFQIDSSLDMINISIDELTQHIEHYDYCGFNSNSIMDDMPINNKPTIHNEENNSTIFKGIKGNNNEDVDSGDFSDSGDSGDNGDSGDISDSNSNTTKIPKVMWPFIFYFYMKADPNSILNIENFGNNKKNEMFNYETNINYQYLKPEKIDVNQLD